MVKHATLKFRDPGFPASAGAPPVLFRSSLAGCSAFMANPDTSGGKPAFFGEAARTQRALSSARATPERCAPERCEPACAATVAREMQQVWRRHVFSPSSRTRSSPSAVCKAGRPSSGGGAGPQSAVPLCLHWSKTLRQLCPSNKKNIKTCICL